MNTQSVVLGEATLEVLPRLHRLYNDCFSVPGRGPREEYDYWFHLFTHPKVKASAIKVGDEIVGAVALFFKRGDWEVTYWVAGQARGRGVATTALGSFLELQRQRPVFARVRHTNKSSIRVLEKCGFSRLKEETTYCDYREEEYLEFVYLLAE